MARSQGSQDKPSNMNVVNSQLSRGINLKMLAILDTEDEATNGSQTIIGEINELMKFESLLKPICNFSGEKSDFCEINGDVRIHGNDSSIFFTSHQLQVVTDNSTFGIKLYARKPDKDLMGKLKQQKLKPTSTEQEMPACTVNHTVPAVVFHAGGYAGNLFHAISDVMIPLYLTTLPFNGEVQFLIEEKHTWWVEKFEVMLKALSKYEIIDLDHDSEIRCFKNAIVGLKAHNDFGINSQMPPFGYTLRDFTHFIRQTYSLERETTIKMKISESFRKPRLLIISRKKTRCFLNEDEIVAEAQGLGYDVEIIDARTLKLKEFSNMVNSFDVMIGVHGAGLTNMVFLPENAILIQVIPLGLESVGRIFYEKPARDMNLKYLQYKISANESSLLEQYPIDHPVILQPKLFEEEGWLKFKSIYLDNQNMRVDIGKFRLVLLDALQLLRQ
ncbi:hypothetical protein Cgig2_006555 [Carnegiea gigantea]|uniref:Glycosyltransferase 61 catalytic domain-containing protein n=1 Tax=Carnegiea gigantea TaxID=171969 RepID=A0A9Q1JTS1_9CARY|nr:hypothetical protein Cgig2_006555 [Carnegiea gigantea]